MQKLGVFLHMSLDGIVEGAKRRYGHKFCPLS